jgi:hypothetical protein
MIGTFASFIWDLGFARGTALLGGNPVGCANALNVI